MSRWLLLTTVTAVLAGPPTAPAQSPPASLPPALQEAGCPVCVVAPTKETKRTPAYGTKEEPFCLRRVSLLTFLRRLCGQDCVAPCCEPPRHRTRLLKWEVTTECERLKCVVERAPAPPATPEVLPPPK
jgi:hypothetical protein